MLYTVDENGAVSKKPSPISSSLIPVNTPDGIAIRDNQQIFSYSDLSIKSKVEDKSLLLPTTSPTFFFDFPAEFLDGANKLYFSQWSRMEKDEQNIKLMDLSTGKPLYDENGKDKEAPMSADNMISAGDKGIYAFNSHSDQLGLIDTQLNLVKAIKLDSVSENDRVRRIMTDSAKEIHVWSIVQ